MFDLIHALIDFILHVDVHLQDLVNAYHLWTYAILFLIIFAETGLVVTPFLPGDSLLFAAGALAANPACGLNVILLTLLLWAAAVLGDTLNYWIGAKLGPKVFTREDSFLLRKKHLERAHAFFEKYGGRAIILARFMPIIRTFVPFVAGIGKMHYSHFIAYNVAGGLLWIFGFVFAGYLFGNLPGVKQNFHIVIAVIIVLSLLPIVVEFIRNRRAQG
ncbi:MAG: DedA family protein [Puniceicoccales bacterium]|jgi:membrane-associated protein|nr:DedA family protein [Puniceicoccales bacterium]